MSANNLKFVVTVYGQTGYVESEAFDNSKRKRFPLLNEAGDRRVGSDGENVFFHRGNVTGKYELYENYVLVYSEVNKLWEAYCGAGSLAPHFMVGAPALEDLKRKLPAH